MKKSYIDWLEQYFSKYSDVPKEVIIKEDLLRQGINFTRRSTGDSMDFRYKTYHLFTYDKTLRSDLGKEDTFTVPEDIRLKKGIYNLLDTVIHVYHNTESPYLIDSIDGKRQLSLDGKPIAEVIFPKKPPYYGLKFEDGTAYEQVHYIQCTKYHPAPLLQ